MQAAAWLRRLLIAAALEQPACISTGKHNAAASAPPAHLVSSPCTAHAPLFSLLQLLDSGRWEVTVFDIRAVEGEDRAQYIVGDLRNAAQVAAACKGAPGAKSSKAAVTHAYQAVLLLRCCATAQCPAQSSLLISMQAQARLGCCNSHKLLRMCCAAMCTNTTSCPLPTHPGMDVVFHVATAAPTATNAHNEALMRAVNIDGTQVGAGSRRRWIPRLRVVCRRQREAAARLPALCQHAAH